MLTVTWMLAAGVKEGGSTIPPAGGTSVGGAVLGGNAVGGTFGGVVLGDTLAGVTVTADVCAGVLAIGGCVSAQLAAVASGLCVGVGNGRSTGSGIACMATAPSGRSGDAAAVGTRVGASGGTGVSVEARVGTGKGAGRDGVAADAEHATRTGKKRSAANTAR